MSYKGNWNEQKGKLKQKFAFLTDNDLIFEDGKEEKMSGNMGTCEMVAFVHKALPEAAENLRRLQALQLSLFIPILAFLPPASV